MLFDLLLVLICTAIGWLVGHPLAGLVAGIILALLGTYNEVRL